MFQNREGHRVPDVTFKVQSDGKWVDVTTADLFVGRTVIVFSLPGAYTPTCSTSHLPRYNELFQVFKENDVDEIVCLSVNDTFVMNAWKKSQKAEHIRFLPDGNGEFTEKMGFLVDKSKIGFGKRSWRYSMLVKDGVIEKMFIERDVEGDPFEVSDADTLLNFINPLAQKPEFVTIFTKEGCPYCAKAKALLKKHGMDYEEIPLGDDVTSRTIRAISGKSTVPQVFIGGTLIGGSDDLEKYLSKK